MVIVKVAYAHASGKRSLLAEKAFHKIDVFEQRSTVAGVWNYTPENDSSSNMSIPQVDPDQGFDKPIWRETPNSSGKHDKQATFVSPLYERLEANLPKYLMQHSDVPFPDDIQLFPTHDDITRYLEDYAAEVRLVSSNIRFLFARSLLRLVVTEASPGTPYDTI